MVRSRLNAAVFVLLAFFACGCRPAGPTETAVASAVLEGAVPQGAPLYSPPSDEMRSDGAGGLSDTDDSAGFDPTAADREREERSAAENPDLLTFKRIADFKYIEPIGNPESLIKNQIPADVVALHGEHVTMEGYMIPIDLDADTNRVKTFFLARSHLGCCFGQLPAVNEVVEVRFENGVKYLPEILLRVEGKFEVGEEFDEYGYLMSIFRMQGTKLEDPWDK